MLCPTCQGSNPGPHIKQVCFHRAAPQPIAGVLLESPAERLRAWSTFLVLKSCALSRVTRVWQSSQILGRGDGQPGAVCRAVPGWWIAVLPSLLADDTVSGLLPYLLVSLLPRVFFQLLCLGPWARTWWCFFFSWLLHMREAWGCAVLLPCVPGPVGHHPPALCRSVEPESLKTTQASEQKS